MNDFISFHVHLSFDKKKICYNYNVRLTNNLKSLHKYLFGSEKSKWF